VIVEIGSREVRPVVFKVFVGVPNAIGINTKILLIGALFPIVAVDVDRSIPVFCVVDLCYLDVFSIGVSKKQNGSERVEGIERGVSPNPDVEHDTSQCACFVQVVKLSGHTRNSETRNLYHNMYQRNKITSILLVVMSYRLIFSFSKPLIGIKSLWFKYNDTENSMSDTEHNVSAPADGEEPRDQSDLRGQMARSLARGGMPNVQVISWESAETALTSKRREIIETLREVEPDSVRALARELERDKSQVSNDLSTLAELGIIRYEQNGNAKAPRLTQDHIVVEPIV